MPISWHSAWPLVAVVERTVDGDSGLDLLECGHSKPFRMDERGYPLAGSSRRCRECFLVLPEMEQRERYDRLRAGVKRSRRA